MKQVIITPTWVSFAFFVQDRCWYTDWAEAQNSIPEK